MAENTSETVTGWAGLPQRTRYLLVGLASAFAAIALVALLGS